MRVPEIKPSGEDSLQVSGDLVMEYAGRLKSQGESLIRSLAGKTIRIDLSQVTQASSAGVSLLLCWLRSARQVGSELQITNMPEDMYDIARVSSLDKVLPISSLETQ